MKRLAQLVFFIITLTLPAFAQHYVALSWTQATDANVVYNNVYRGSQHGGPYTLKVFYPAIP